MKKLVALLFVLIYVSAVSAYTERNLLQKQADMNRLKEVLVLDRKWVTYPDYDDRAGWDAFLGAFKEEYIRRGEKMLDYRWQVVRATDYLAFERTGDRKIMEDPFGANNNAIADLLMAELAEGKGRFIDQLVNGVFHTCEMTSWALSAHIIVQPTQRALPAYDYPVIDLTSGDLGGLLSWTYYFMHRSFDKMDPEISRRLRHELQTRILDPYVNNDSFWWMARNYNGRMLNNWNPWCNSNVLMCFMLLEDDRDKLARGVYLTMESVDKFLNYIKADGACEEGPSYWGHAAGKTLDYLELLSAITGGKVDIFADSMVRSMGEYISRSYVGDGWVVNFADASAHGGGDASLIYRFGKAVNSDELKGFAALMRKPSALPHNGRDIFRTLTSIAIDKELQQTAPMHENRPFTWYPETEFCYLSTKEGLFLAAKGGYNDESHNHNDAGTCSVWMDRTPVLIDAGVGTYTRQTFSSERYSIWTMQSDYHNLPMINGVSEKYGKKYKATEVKAGKSSFEANIATAYPEEAKVKRWIRSYQVKGRQARISDSFELEETVAPNVVNFMTWGEVEPSEKGRVSIRVGRVNAVLLYDAALFDLTVEPLELTDSRLSNVWGNTICRLSFKAKQQTKKGNYSFTIKKL
ncbi:heparinase II/III family protein [Bacteroides sp.]|uniref:heparinase II/III domain-containing protein n=1 Tax=Bacteroides sp. TaxID=29523 RepID=UPI0023C41B6E|nr:heparinase II/III family protein [Bacteroides sp.]MDE6215907.1 heparinase II/III-family protein [Bacteroides sp.]